MNAVAEIEPGVTFAHAAPLLKEYASKLKELGDGVLNHLAESGILFAAPNTGMIRDELIGRFKHLRSPIEELIRRSSAVLEQGQLNGLEKVELWLRLAELEHNFDIAARRVDLIKLKK